MIEYPCLIYLHHATPWSVPEWTPQVLHDDVFDYVAEQLSNKSTFMVGTRHQLTEEEARLPINELVEKYPPPRGAPT